MEKLCRTCGETKLFSEFHKQAKAHDGVQSRCKACDKVIHAARYQRDKEKINVQTRLWKENNKEKAYAAGKEWRKRNPDKVRKAQRKSNLKKNFDLSVEEYEKMLQAQDGVCAICKEPETYIHKNTGAPARLAVDHCHAKGHVRKLLCKACNNGLGLFRDNPVLLVQAAQYLKDNDGRAEF